MAPMTKNINHIIASVLTGEATERERTTLNKWLQDPKNFGDFIKIREKWEAKYEEPELIGHHEKRDRLQEDIRINRKKGIRWGYFIKVTAIVIMVMAMSFFIIRRVSNEIQEDRLEGNPLIEKTTPPGVKSTFDLPDGSRVTLNAGSQLIFPTLFDDTVRYVELKGEAFFHVAWDPLRPFIVKSANTLTTALGTSFDISAYLDDEKVNIALSDGKLKVDMLKTDAEEILLDPGEYVSLRQGDILKKGLFDKDTMLGWKDDLLVFNQSDFNTTIKKLERWYGVKFIYKHEPTWTFNGKFHNENLKNVLEALSHGEKFRYSINQKTVTLTFYETS